MSSIVPAPNGLLVYNTDSCEFYYFNSCANGWQNLCSESDTIGHICGAPSQDNRDSVIYSTVQIGPQCWMAENLNTGIMIDRSISQSDNGTIEKWCYGNVEDSCDVYGGLYHLHEMMAYKATECAQGICPVG